jgi:hypothetical protein
MVPDLVPLERGGQTIGGCAIRTRKRISVVTATVAGLFMWPQAAHAAPAVYSVTLSQTFSSGQVGQKDVLRAKPTANGVAAPDGTQVRFHPEGGLIADHVYDGMAVKPDGSGYWLAGVNGTVRNFGSAGAMPGAPTRRRHQPGHRPRHRHGPHQHR